MDLDPDPGYDLDDPQSQPCVFFLVYPEHFSTESRPWHLSLSLSLSLSPPPPPPTTTTTTQIEWTAYRLCHRICVVIKYATHEVFDASGFDVFLIRYWQESVYSLSESVEVLLQRASVDFLTWK